MKNKFESTYDIIKYLCQSNEIRVRFYQKFTTELYPEFDFGNLEINNQLFSPLLRWFLEGYGKNPYEDITIVFKIEDDVLVYKFENERIDDYFFPNWGDSEEDEYLLDIELLKDDNQYLV